MATPPPPPAAPIADTGGGTAAIPAPARFGRVPELDGIRAIAVGMVIVSHAGLGKVGGLGVNLFFFLSGYLIVSLMRAENAERGTVSLKGFYLRRFVRIVLPLYITLGLCALLVAVGLVPVAGRLDPFTVFSQFAFFHNYVRLWGDPLSLPVTGVWSLAVEEHFYLVFPLLYLFVLRRLRPAAQAGACLALCALALGFRLLDAAIIPDYRINYLWTHTRMDAILAGAVLALWRNPAMDADHWHPPAWTPLAALALILAANAVRATLFRETFRYTLESAAFYALFAWALAGRGVAQRLLASPPATLVARYSYTLYLAHVTMLMLAERIVPGRPVSAFCIGVALSFLYAALMYRFVERPLGRLRHRLHRETVGELEPAPAVAA